MTQEQKTMIGEHFDMLHAKAIEIAPNIPDDISQAMKDAYMAGADYAIDMFACNWVSVDDELPPIRQSVIAYNGVTNRIAWVLEDGSWIADTHIGWERNCFKTYPVTHWMPLPPTKGIKGNQGKISPNQKQIIGTADHIKTALDVMDKKGGEQ